MGINTQVHAEDPAPFVVPSPDQNVSQETFDAANPLTLEGDGSIAANATPGDILTRALSFLFPLAGLALFAMLVWAGFEILAGATSKKVDAGQQRATAAIIGFILLFVSYWIIQLLEIVFEIAIF